MERAPLTHHLNFEISFGRESLRVLGHARVRSLVQRSLHVLHDQRAVREHLLAAVDRQNAATCNDFDDLIE